MRFQRASALGRCGGVERVQYSTGILYGVDLVRPRTRNYRYFPSSRQISLSISLRVTPQATLTPAGTSKPRDTRRILATQANAYPSHFPTDTPCVPITHINGGRPLSYPVSVPVTGT
jgi:hypothetical protein